jgi:hypothetical protein
VCVLEGGGVITRYRHLYTRRIGHRFCVRIIVFFIVIEIL